LNNLSVYLVKDRITNYTEAIRSISGVKPIDGILSFKLHASGLGGLYELHNRATLVRSLGSTPIIQVNCSNELYSSIKLDFSPVSSLVGTLNIGSNLIVCALNECDIVSIDVDLNSIDVNLNSMDVNLNSMGITNNFVGNEVTIIEGKHVFPWMLQKIYEPQDVKI